MFIFPAGNSVFYCTQMCGQFFQSKERIQSQYLSKLTLVLYPVNQSIKCRHIFTKPHTRSKLFSQLLLWESKDLFLTGTLAKVTGCQKVLKGFNTVCTTHFVASYYHIIFNSIHSNISFVRFSYITFNITFVYYMRILYSRSVFQGHKKTHI